MRSCMPSQTTQTVNGRLTRSMLVFMSAGAALTCLKHGGDVGGALTVRSDRRHVDLVLLATFVYGDLAAGGG